MKLYSFAPDLDPTTEGVIVSCDHVVPSRRGLAHAPSAVNSTINTATAQSVVGGVSVFKIDASSRTFIATSTKLFEQQGDTWTARSSTLTTVFGRWRFAQYGDVTLAASKENVVQYSTSGDFATLTGTSTAVTVTAPSAALIEVVNDFIFLADTTGVTGYVGDQGDRWICSALGDYTNFVPDIGTQCVTGRLTSVPGRITAARKFGDQIVLYKRKGIYLGTYVGPPLIWDFREIPAQCGTWCHESVVNIGTPEAPLHFFVGEQDFYIFDGARPMSIGEGVREYFSGRLNYSNGQLVCCLHDRSNTRIYVYYPSSSSASLDSALVYNYRTKRWGVDNVPIQFAFEYTSPGYTYDDLTSGTYDSLTGATYDSYFLGSQRPLPAIINQTYKLQTLTGSGSSATIVTGDVGDDEVFTTIYRLKPKWLTAPTGASLANYYRNSLGDSLTFDVNTTMGDSRFDVIRSARWHRFAFTVAGSFEFNEIKLDARIDGNE